MSTKLSYLKDFLFKENEVGAYKLMIGDMYIVYFTDEGLILSMKFNKYIYEDDIKDIKDIPVKGLFDDKIINFSPSVRFFNFPKTIKIYYEHYLRDIVSLLPSNFQIFQQKFPEKWDIMVGAFHDIFKDQEWKKIAEQVYHRAMEKPDCSIFKNYDTKEQAIRDMKDEINYYLFGIDKGEFDVFGMMQLGNFFLIEDKNTGEKHFAVMVEWRCSFTTTEEVYEHYSEMKKKGYDISAAKFLQIELMKLMSSILKDRSIREMMKSNFYDMDNMEDNIKNITHITVISCSLPSALFYHLKNGAQVMSKAQQTNYKPYTSLPLKGLYFCGGSQIPIYWTQRIE